MNVLFEEEGAFKAGVVLADQTTSLQVELPSGKRSKVKAANVLLRFDGIAPAELMAKAEAGAEEIEADFLWEVCPDDEFGFEALAEEYQGHKPTPAESAAVLLRLHSAPMYFHRKGKGRFRKAPPDILQAALAGLEKKKQQAAAAERMVAQLKAGQLPAEIAPLLTQMLYKPDRNRLETKALEAACGALGVSVPRLLQQCGALNDTHDYHLGKFLFEFFPKGTDYPTEEVPSTVEGLPMAAVQAFSIDDAHTTEIDDAFSVAFKPDGGMTVGIHIAAPGLGITPDSALGQEARVRLSTVYMPGRKITMLPDAVVECFTLAAGRTVPALSLYLDVAADLRILSHETRLEMVAIAANLRHHDIEPVFNEETLAAGLGDFPFSAELKRLWELATVLEAGRGAAGQQNRKDYNFVVDWGRDTAFGPGHIEIGQRSRGSPLDTLVAELMIVANATWGKRLAEAGIPGLYRVQTGGKVRMSTVAAPHEGLGVDCYAWSSSPLRRYVDLVNQWQLISNLRGEAPVFPPKSAELMAAMRDFEITYAAYADFQRAMERYWCLRWLAQEGVRQATATVIKESLVRLDDVPLVLKVPSLPALDRGVAVRLEIGAVDLLEAEGQARYLELLATPAPDAALSEEEEEGAGE
ncbi:MAG: RNB domain-containing ribonuclease [Rhodocyclaceae bacterium]|nr:MAG: RNB domain-containing ribonuclease [Rhodocyclaceae bacterium]